MPKKSRKQTEATGPNAEAPAGAASNEPEQQLVCLGEDTLPLHLQPNDENDCDKKTGQEDSDDDHVSDDEGNVDPVEVAKLEAQKQKETDPVQKEVLETALIQLTKDAAAISKTAGQINDNLPAQEKFEGKWIGDLFEPPTSSHLPQVPKKDNDGNVVEDAEGNTVMTNCQCFMQEAMAIGHGADGMPVEMARKDTVGQREPKPGKKFRPDSEAGNAGLGGEALQKTDPEGSYKWVKSLNGDERQVFCPGIYPSGWPCPNDRNQVWIMFMIDPDTGVQHNIKVVMQKLWCSQNTQIMDWATLHLDFSTFPDSASWIPEVKKMMQGNLTDAEFDKLCSVQELYWSSNTKKPYGLELNVNQSVLVVGDFESDDDIVRLEAAVLGDISKAWVLTEQGIFDPEIPEDDRRALLGECPKCQPSSKWCHCVGLPAIPSTKEGEQPLLAGLRLVKPTGLKDDDSEDDNEGDRTFDINLELQKKAKQLMLENGPVEAEVEHQPELQTTGPKPFYSGHADSADEESDSEESLTDPDSDSSDNESEFDDEELDEEYDKLCLDLDETDTQLKSVKDEIMELKNRAQELKNTRRVLKKGMKVKRVQFKQRRMQPQGGSAALGGSAKGGSA